MGTKNSEKLVGYKATTYKAIILTIISSCILTALLVIISLASFHSHRTLMARHHENEVKIISSAIKNELTEVISDLHYIASDNALKTILDLGQNHQAIKSRTLEGLKRLSQAKGCYNQIRVLNANGNEVIRVDNENNQAVIIPDNKLQNKSGRYYFTDSINLNHGDIFISPLDLNVEHGKIEQPLKPMIRFGTPLINETGDKIGVVILNYCGTKILNKITKASDSPDESNVSMLNSDGYWLKASQANLEWGFMYSDRQEERFESQFP